MQAFVFWTGILSGAVGVAFQIPAFTARLLPGSYSALLQHVFGMVAIFLGVMLVICSRDPKSRGVLVAWEGVLRVVGGVVIAGYGFFVGMGAVVGLAGLADLAIGAIYLVWLPRWLGVSLIDLLLDRRVES
jgi:hypothetical protein